jgi:hypothetical protein
LKISWGPGSLDPQPIVASWKLQTQDINGVEVSFFFHLASHDIPLLIGHDILRNSVVNFNHHPSWVEIRLRNTIVRFPIYTHGQRTRIEIAPIHHTNLLSNNPVLLGDAENSHTARDHCATAAQELQTHIPQDKYHHLSSLQDCIPTRMRRLETFASFCNAQGC